MNFTLGIFIIILLITLGITYWAARRTHTTSDFYAADSQLTAAQNGFALAGDWCSAAAFLGFILMMILSLVHFNPLTLVADAEQKYTAKYLLPGNYLKNPFANWPSFSHGSTIMTPVAAVPSSGFDRSDIKVVGVQTVSRDR
ncbi:MAG: sodium solute transporter superfamily [Bradyrhizobium sp.]|nr:sodium solute transporter superfamily [Bradyrhizobium sp.]